MANKVYPLKRSSNFKEASTLGRRLKLASWLNLQIVNSIDSKNYFGITVSRKVGGAVVRNKLKRWVRNCVHTEKWPEKFESKTVVFVFRPQTEKLFYSKIKYAEFLLIYKKI